MVLMSCGDPGLLVLPGQGPHVRQILCSSLSVSVSFYDVHGCGLGIPEASALSSVLS